MADAIAAQPQPGNGAADADALLDQFLEGVSPSEDTPAKEQRKVAKSGDPEDEPSEDEPKKPAEGDEPEDDDEGAEDEEDTDDEDDAEDDEEDQSEEAGRFVGHDGRVKLADGTTTTVAELIRGNLREADYTRKTQETGALHQELSARLADYAQQEQIVALAIEIMAQALPPEPDPMLLQPGEGHDPVAYSSQRLLWEHASKQLHGLMQAKEQMGKQQQAIQGTLLKKYALEQKDKLLAKHPELRDKAKLDAYHSGLVKTLRHYGKGEADLAQVYDADIILMIEELGEYRKIKAARKAAKRKAQGAPVLAPGTRQSINGKQARVQKADWETLRTTGSKGAAGEQALDRILDNILR